MEAQALRERGWSVRAIARHLGRDRKTIAAYLSGERVPGRRVRREVDPFADYAQYCRIRLGDDPHLWATTLFDEVSGLGYPGSYPSFTRALRLRSLRPVCAPCAAARGGGDRALIAHPAGEETQWDWVELPDPPPGWGWGRHAHLLVGALSHSGRWRGWLAESEDQAHLVEGLHQVASRLGGLSRVWRFDRMATVFPPGGADVSASFAAVALHYGVAVAGCPPRHGWRKGVVEKANHTAAQRWWRTLADEVSVAAAQASVDRLSGRLDSRARRRDGVRVSVGELAAGEPLRRLPAAYPAVIEVTRTVSAQALVSFRGNQYSVGPGYAGRAVLVRAGLADSTVVICTAAGVSLAGHHREPDGAGAIVRAAEHVAALETAVLAAFTDRPACQAKSRRPPSPAATAEALRLRGQRSAGQAVVIDLARYAEGTRPFTGTAAVSGEELR